jgi:hypothetical protein
MLVRPVDPRDIDWESARPDYRVTFSRELPGGAQSEEEFEVSHAGVTEVLDWAAHRANELGISFRVGVVVTSNAGKGLVALHPGDARQHDG